jgi:hypothetical protein
MAIMRYPLGLWNSWFAVSAQAMRMCWEAQTVVFLRSLRLAQGDAWAEAEAQRMISEKVAALTEAQIAAATATLRAASDITSRRKQLCTRLGSSHQATRREEALNSGCVARRLKFGRSVEANRLSPPRKTH